jgi:prepilin-type N-terminal cleavage/methylation domain-containing protein
MTATRRSPARGFTLIELMIVVTIIGLLSTVALPVYKRATLRARAAERATMLQSMKMGLEDAFVRNKVPVAGGLVGIANPPGTPSTSKRHFDNAAAGWSEIGVVVQGDCYYSYDFTASESTTGSSGTDAVFRIDAVGDLDGDGVQSTKQIGATRTAGHWEEIPPIPPDGEEDETTF